MSSIATQNSSWDDIPTLELITDDDWKNSIDKRKQQRITENDLKRLFKRSSDIPIKLFSRRLNLIDGKLVDISKSGIKAKLGKSLLTNEIVEVAIFLAHRRLTGKGIVRWVREQHDDASYELGVEFLEISPKDSSYIGSIITTSFFERTTQSDSELIIVP